MQNCLMQWSCIAAEYTGHTLRYNALNMQSTSMHYKCVGASCSVALITAAGFQWICYFLSLSNHVHYHNSNVIIPVPIASLAHNSHQTAFLLFKNFKREKNRLTNEHIQNCRLHAYRYTQCLLTVYRGIGSLYNKYVLFILYT